MRLGAAFVALVLLAPAARADGDPARGEEAFQQCYSCHSLDPREAGLEGPDLAGILGRPIAARPGFAYSAALRALAGQEGTWSAALLDRFIAAPYRVAPRTLMGYPGLPDAQARADLIAYLAARR